MAKYGTEPKQMKTGLFARWKRAFQSAFSDGYQLGDVLKSIISPLSDNNKESDFSYLQGGSSLLNNITGAVDNNSQSVLGEVKQFTDESREQFLEDREHTEEREDTAYQRSVEDMRKAGLNPYTISSSPSNSSVSQVGQNSINTQLQTLGYILDLKNLNAYNRQITNNLIGNIISAVSRR